MSTLDETEQTGRKGGNNAREIQATQHTLATVMEKIQNHLMQDGDADENPMLMRRQPFLNPFFLKLDHWEK